MQARSLRIDDQSLNLVSGRLEALSTETRSSKSWHSSREYKSESQAAWTRVHGRGSASQIALFVAPVLVLVSYFVGPTPMDLHFWPGAVVMILIAIVVAAFVTNGGRSAWFVGALLLMVYMVFAMTLYLLPPGVQ